MVPLSVLDLVPVVSGSSAREAMRRTEELARLAERLGYVRYWFAEHHGMASIASSSPELLIEHIAAATERIRVGSGGIMLPNHAPLRVAEAFHTLETLHPHRIDLGIGRAPGTDAAHIRALRSFDGEQFPQQLAELLALSRGDFPEGHPFRAVRVVPSEVELPPVWLLGSSGASAQMAGDLGMGYAFASHFSPASPVGPMRAYLAAFTPSAAFAQPSAILAVSVVCAESRDVAEHHAASLTLAGLRLQRGEFKPLPSPEEALAYRYSEEERFAAEAYRSRHIVGTPEEVRARIERMVDETGATEVMITTMVHDHAARLRSYELVAGAISAEGSR
ncbi:MAG TPA: LLM class flavin-dependent oxidoreductase [Thermoanaerobaculia bacterium]|nr:LLM class flavin-dependent oxidoreductase [Thermoanaerobaculia bacterium]